MRISDWSSDVCSSDLVARLRGVAAVGVLQEGRSPFPRVVADAGAFDLDHVGAEVGEDLPGPGARHDAAEVEDPDVRERDGHDPSPAKEKGARETSPASPPGVS